METEGEPEKKKLSETAASMQVPGVVSWSQEETMTPSRPRPARKQPAATWKKLLLRDMLPGVDRDGGKRLSGGEGKIYFNARYYDPTLGRFLTEDPSRKGHSWYTYCANNPITYTDPTGMLPVDEVVEMVERAGVGDIQAARMAASYMKVDPAASLRVRQSPVLADPQLQPGGPGPYGIAAPFWCNVATYDVIGGQNIIKGSNLALQAFIGNADPANLVANQAIDIMNAQVAAGKLKIAAPAKAQQLANNAFTVVGGSKAIPHGHLATVSPSADPANFADPLIANVGTTVGIMKASEAFAGASVTYFYNPAEFSGGE